MTTCRKQHYFVCTEPDTVELYLIPSSLHVGRNRKVVSLPYLCRSAAIPLQAFSKKKSAKLSEGLLLLCGVQVVFPVCVSEHAGAKSCFGG